MAATTEPDEPWEYVWTRRNDPPAPLVRLEEPVPVTVLDPQGRQWPGFVTAWRGRWVYCQWSEGPGMRHIEFVLGENVRRV